MTKSIIFALLLLTACTPLKPTAAINDTPTQHLIPVKVWNNSLLPHRYALIGYEPGNSANWTEIFWLMPGASRHYRLPLGSTVYRANNRQVGTVMGGGSLRNEPPFITLKAADAGRRFRLRW